MFRPLGCVLSGPHQRFCRFAGDTETAYRTTAEGTQLTYGIEGVCFISVLNASLKQGDTMLFEHFKGQIG